MPARPKKKKHTETWGVDTSINKNNNPLQNHLLIFYLYEIFIGTAYNIYLNYQDLFVTLALYAIYFH